MLLLVFWFEEAVDIMRRTSYVNRPETFALKRRKFYIRLRTTTILTHKDKVKHRYLVHIKVIVKFLKNIAI